MLTLAKKRGAVVKIVFDYLKLYGMKRHIVAPGFQSRRERHTAYRSRHRFFGRAESTENDIEQYVHVLVVSCDVDICLAHGRL